MFITSTPLGQAMLITKKTRITRGERIMTDRREPRERVAGNNLQEESVKKLVRSSL